MKTFKRRSRSQVPPASYKSVGVNLLCLLVLLLLAVTGCSESAKETTPATDTGGKKAPIQVAVSILPQKYFVERIAGEDVQVNVLVPPGSSPATYAPTPRQMQQLSRAKLYFRIGHIPFEEAWMGNLTQANTRMKVIDTSQGVKLYAMTDDLDNPSAEAHHQAEEHEEHHHHHKGIDPHIWLSPSAVKIQAKHILDALLTLDQSDKEKYTVNYQRFIADIEDLNNELHTVLRPLEGKRFMVFHPSWGYLAREYGMVQLPIEIEGKSPGPATLKRIIDIAKKENINVIFVQQQFDTNSARAVAAEIGGEVIQLDPLAQDWLQNMKKIAASLKQSLK